MRAFKSIETGEIRYTDNPDHITQILRRAGWVEIPYVETPVDITNPIPEQVPMWAFRRRLRKRGLLDTIFEFIKTLPKEQSEDAIEHLEYGNFIHRNHPMIVASAVALQIPESTVDDIFREAESEV